MPYNSVVPPRAHSDNPDVVYKFYGGRNRPGKIVYCNDCKQPRWVALNNLFQSFRCQPCKNLKPCVCDFCKKEFRPSNKGQKFCTRVCADAYKKGPNFLKPKMAHGKRTAYKCARCNKEFYSTPSQGRIYCSGKCSNRATSKFGKDNPLYIDGRSKNYRNYERLQLFQWRNLAKEIRKRDNYTCLICGSQPKRLLHVHHIIPHAEGGLDHPSNLATLCLSCHTKYERVKDIREKLISLVKEKPANQDST